MDNKKRTMPILPPEQSPARFIFLLTLVWVVSGIAALITAITCFNYSGDKSSHLNGLLLSIFIGPFFWVYYFLKPGYCG